MIRIIRNSAVVKFLTIILGLYLLNISVDPTDPEPNHIPENLEINDQESIVEIVIEEILGYDNAISECDDHDFEDQGKNSKVVRDFTVHYGYDLQTSLFLREDAREDFPCDEGLSHSGFQNLNTPPPRT